MQDAVSPKQVARAIGVSEASVKRWCDKGLLTADRTAGGHRRIELSAVLDFLRETQRPLVRPEVIGLPATSGRTEAVLSRAVPRFIESLEAGDEGRVRAVLFDLHLAGHSVDAIADWVIAPAFREIGRRWESGVCDVYMERRACELALRGVYGLSGAIVARPLEGPVAIGGTLEGDWYAQPTTLVELTLRQRGWRAASLGSGIPVGSFFNALSQIRPRLCWLSVSYFTAVEPFLEDYSRLSEAADRLGVPLVVGGFALTEDVRKQMRYSAFCDNMGHLVSFISALPPHPKTS